MLTCRRHQRCLYSGRSSRSAQARAIALLGASVPGAVAQPPFSMISRRSQVEAFLNSVNFAGASACAWNFSTQIGVSTSTTAASARSFAIRSAVPPSAHPKTGKPSTDMPAAPIAAPQIPGYKPEGSFIDLMSCAPVNAPFGHCSRYRIPETITVGAPRQYVVPRMQEPTGLSQISNKIAESGLPWTCGPRGSGVG